MASLAVSNDDTARGPLKQPIYLISDGGGLRSTGKLISAIEAALRGAKLTSGESGIGVVQLREQVGSDSASDEELVRLGVELLPICRDFNTRLIVNRRIDLAQVIGADGVHLGADTIRLLPSNKSGLMFGYSAHKAEEGLKAIEKGFDYLFFSPVFEPLSKVSNRPTRGREALAQVCGAASKPVFALGGITAQNARSCRVSGAAGIAVITSILGSADPGVAARELLDAWFR